MRRSYCLVLALALLAPAAASARTTVRVRANQPADVFLDGSRVGVTPVNIPSLRGRHTIRLRSRISGEESTTHVRAGGRRHHRATTVRAHFSRTVPHAWRSGYPRPYGYRRGWRHHGH